MICINWRNSNDQLKLNIGEPFKNFATKLQFNLSSEFRDTNKIKQQTNGCDFGPSHCLKNCRKS
jgi:hypothetical protein